MPSASSASQLALSLESINSNLDECAALLDAEAIGEMTEDYFEELLKLRFHDDVDGLLIYLVAREQRIKRKLSALSLATSTLQSANAQLQEHLELQTNARSASVLVSGTSKNFDAEPLRESRRSLGVASAAQFLPSETLLSSSDDSAPPPRAASREVTDPDAERVAKLQRTQATSAAHEAELVAELFTLDVDTVLEGRSLTGDSREETLMRSILRNDPKALSHVDVVNFSRAAFLPCSGLSYAHLCVLLGVFKPLRQLVELNPAVIFATDTRGNACHMLFAFAQTLKALRVACDYDIERAFNEFLQILSTRLSLTQLIALFSSRATNASGLNWASVDSNSSLFYLLAQHIDQGMRAVFRSCPITLHDAYCCKYVSKPHATERPRVNLCYRAAHSEHAELLRSLNTNELLKTTKYRFNVKKVEIMGQKNSHFIHHMCVTDVSDGTLCCMNYLSPTEDLSRAQNSLTKLKTWDRLGLLEHLASDSTIELNAALPVYSTPGLIYLASGYLSQAKIENQFQLVLGKTELYYRVLLPTQHTPSVTLNREFYTCVAYDQIQQIRLLRNIEGFFVIKAAKHEDLVINVENKYVYISALCRAMRKSGSHAAQVRYAGLNFIDYTTRLVYPLYDSSSYVHAALVVTRNPTAEVYGECIIVATYVTEIYERFLLRALRAVFWCELFNTFVSAENIAQHTPQTACLLVYEDGDCVFLQDPAKLAKPLASFNLTQRDFAAADIATNAAVPQSTLLQSLQALVRNNLLHKPEPEGHFLVHCTKQLCAFPTAAAVTLRFNTAKRRDEVLHTLSCFKAFS